MVWVDRSRRYMNAIAQLLFLDAQDPEKDIYVYINFQEEAVTAGLAIYW